MGQSTSTSALPASTSLQLISPPWSLAPTYLNFTNSTTTSKYLSPTGTASSVSFPDVAPTRYVTVPYDGGWAAYNESLNWTFPDANNSYRESDACSLSAESILRASGSVTVSVFLFPYTTTTAGGSSGIVTTSTVRYTSTGGPAQACCGQCSLIYPIVHVLYWPIGACTITPTVFGKLATSTTQNVTSTPVITSPSILPRTHSLISTNGSLGLSTGDDGFVYTSPSVYVIIDTISASDWCGQVGSPHTSVTLSYAPQDLSTWPIDVGSFHPLRRTALPFNLNALECAPSSTSMVTQLSLDANGSLTWTYVPQHGLPWLPDIAPPTNIRNIDSAWETCRVDIYGGQGWDPPRALTPIVANSAQTTIATEVPAMPAVTSQLPANPQPPVTSVPVDPALSTTNSPVRNTAVPAPIASAPPVPQDPIRSTNADAVISSVSAAPSPVPQAQNNPSSAVSAPNAANPNIPIPLTQAQADPGSGQVPQASPALGGSVIPSIVAVGGQTLTNNGPPVTIGGTQVAFSSGLVVVGSSVVQPPARSPNQQNPNTVVVAGITIAPVQSNSQPTIQTANAGGQSPDNSPGQLIGGQTILPGVSTNIAGTPVVLGSAGLVVGSTTIPVVPQKSASPLAVVGGQPISAVGNYGNIAIAGSILSPGQQATIAGTPISVGPSGILVGASSIPLPAPIPAPIVETVAGQVVSAAGPPGKVVVGGYTLSPGQQGNIAGMPVSVGALDIAIGTSTVPFPGQAPASPVATIDGQVISVVGVSGNVAIGGSIFTPGQQGNVGGTPISLGPSAVIIGTNTVALPAQAPASPLATVGGQAVHAVGASGNVAVGGSILTPGQQVTISGTPIAVSQGNVIIGGSTVALPGTGPGLNSLPLINGQSIQTLANGGIVVGGSVITSAAGGRQPTPLPQIGGQAITPLGNGNVVIGSSTLSPGQQAKILGTPISIGSGNILIGSQTYGLVQAPDSSLTTPPPQIGGQGFTPLGNGNLAIGGTTLSPGQRVTISGTPVAFGTGNVVVGGQTYALGPPPLPTIEGQRVTPLANGNIAIAGSTLSPGQQLTIAGTPVLVGTGNVVIGGQTYALNPSTPAPISGLVIGGSTLMPGAAPVTLAGQVVSLGTNGNLAVGTQIIAISSLVAQESAAQASGLQPMLAIGSTTFPIIIPTSKPTSGSSQPSDVTIAGSTLYSGGPAITIGDTPVSLGSAGLVIGGSTAGAGQSIFTVNGQTLTANFEYLTSRTPVNMGAMGGAIYSAFHPEVGSPSVNIAGRTSSSVSTASSVTTSQASTTQGVIPTASQAHAGGSSRLRADMWLLGIAGLQFINRALSSW